MHAMRRPILLWSSKGLVLAVLGALVLTSAPICASARPMDAGLQQQLLALYHRYNADIAAGRLDDALTLRSSAARTELAGQLKTPKDRQDYLSGVGEMVPDQIEVRHGSVDDAGDRALLITWADKKLTAGAVQTELDLGFVREGGVWKLGDVVQGPGPGDIKHCTDQSYQPVGAPGSAYDTSHAVTLAGRIERVDFQPGYTLVLVLSGNTETCAFLPDRTVLQQHGLDPTILQPYRFADISGVAARDNAQKVIVNNITVRAEE